VVILASANKNTLNTPEKSDIFSTLFLKTLCIQHDTVIQNSRCKAKSSLTSLSVAKHRQSFFTVWQKPLSNYTQYNDTTKSMAIMASKLLDRSIVFSIILVREFAAIPLKK